MLFSPFSAQSYKSTTTKLYILLFIVSYQSLREIFLVGDSNARTSSHQGQDFNGINLLEILKPNACESPKTMAITIL